MRLDRFIRCDVLARGAVDPAPLLPVGQAALEAARPESNRSEGPNGPIELQRSTAAQP